MIRTVQKKDISDLCQICRDSLNYPECTEKIIENGISRLDGNREEVFVWEQDDKVVGFIHVELYGVIYFDLLSNILGLAVLKNYQKKGIGKALLLAAENWAKEKGAKGVRIISGISRINAHQFYEYMGYKSEKQNKRFLKEFN